MNDINELFFELIRVAIGTQEMLSRAPSAEEWKALYDMAKKQSLVGVCFAGVQRLSHENQNENENHLEPCDVLQTRWNMPEMQYLTWMGMAAKVKQMNEVVNRQCVELQRMLAADGLRSCILKGQGVASLYGALTGLRQSGDIDAWVDGSKEKILAWAKAHGCKKVTGDLHVDCEVFADTAVELHFTPSVASSPKINHRLQKWFESRKDECMTNQVGTFTTPTTEFNVVYLLHHMFRHYLYEGIGLRQILDYYFTLVAYAYVNARKLSVNYSYESDEVLCILENLGLMKFAGAVMYVMREVFGMDEQYMICPADVKRGRRLLEVIIEGGNFGHGTEKYKVTGWDKPWSRLSRYFRRNWYMLWDYPEEIVWNIITKLKI